MRPIGAELPRQLQPVAIEGDRAGPHAGIRIEELQRAHDGAHGHAVERRADRVGRSIQELRAELEAIVSERPDQLRSRREIIVREGRADPEARRASNRRFESRHAERHARGREEVPS